MKKVAQQIISIFILTVLLTQMCFAAATDHVDYSDPYSLATVDVNTLSQKQLDILSENIQAYNNEEYDAFLAYMVNISDDYTALRENLNLVGVNLSEIQTAYVPEQNDGLIMPLTEATRAKISMYYSTRTGSTNTRATASYQLLDTEGRPGSYDAVVLYFDSTRASFVDYSAGTYSSLKSGIKALEGTLVFNFYDGQARTNFSTCTVEVRPKTTGKVTFGADWTHTYLTSDISVSLNPSVSYSGSGKFSGTIGATIDFDERENKWEKAVLDSY